MIVNAEDQILGRMATQVARQLKKGEEVTILNAEKCVISGHRTHLLEEFRAKRARGQRYFGPFYPKMPDRVIKRTIKGMLPKRKEWGVESMNRLKVYNGVPVFASLENAQQFESAHKSKLKMGAYISLGDIAEHVGAKVKQ